MHGERPTADLPGVAIFGGSNCVSGEAAMLHGLAIETSAMSIKTLPDNFTTTHNNATVAVFQSGPGGLVKAKRQIIVSLHFGMDCVEIGR